MVRLGALGSRGLRPCRAPQPARFVALGCLFGSLIPHLGQLRAALLAWDPREDYQIPFLANGLATISLPLAVFCVAWLLTEGASRKRNGGKGAPRYPGKAASWGVLAVVVGLACLFVALGLWGSLCGVAAELLGVLIIALWLGFRVLPVGVGLSFLFLGVVVFGSLLEFVVGLPPALVITFLSGYWIALATAGRGTGGTSLIAAAAFGLIAASWVPVSWLPPPHACH
jgi:hypothetical protein